MNNFLNKLTNYLTSIPRDTKYRRLLPKNPCTEDIFLVSYPKSGNTWLRFLIANTLKIHYQIQRDVNFFTMNEFIPDVHLATGFMNVHSEYLYGNQAIPRIIKSHSEYNKYYHRVILLVRDPRDVILSYFHYRQKFGNIPNNYTLSDFIHHKDYGAIAWKKHTESWVKTIRSGQIIKPFRYEDFVKNTQEELHNLMDLLGIKVEESTLIEAIKLSSKENMSNSEINHSSDYLVKTQRTPFVRKGKATYGKEMSEENRQIIENITRDTGKLLGYSY